MIYTTFAPTVYLCVNLAIVQFLSPFSVIIIIICLFSLLCISEHARFRNGRMTNVFVCVCKDWVFIHSAYSTHNHAYSTHCSYVRPPRNDVDGKMQTRESEKPLTYKSGVLWFSFLFSLSYKPQLSLSLSLYLSFYVCVRKCVVQTIPTWAYIQYRIHILLFGDF